MSRQRIRTALYLLGLSLLTTSCATTERLVDRAGDAAEREAGERVDRGVSAGADAAEDAVVGGGEGEASSTPAPGNAPSGPGAAGPTPGMATGTYDFEPGTRTILFNDFSGDNLGDFPRDFRLSRGSFDIVEWQGQRYLRALSGGILAIPLPETLPSRFTLESSVSLQHGNAYFRIMPGRAYQGPDRNYRGSVVSVRLSRAGVEGREGPSAMASFDRRLVQDDVASLQVMADGEHMKVYLGGKRTANVPNAVFPRTDTLFVAVGSANENNPILMGPIRIASGGADLYSTLESEGRVALEGIYFDTGSDELRPESHATLAEVGTMLQQYPDLNLSIEGHTDSQGDDAYNLDLSDRRAASVRRYLVNEFGIEATRLSSRGLGETQPVASNDTPEGRQQNRRVELVRMR